MLVIKLIHRKRTTIKAKNNNNYGSHDEHFIDYDGDEDDSSPLWHSLSSPRKCGVPWFLCTTPDTLPGSDWRRQTGREDEPCTATGQRVQQGDSQCTLHCFPCCSNDKDVEDFLYNSTICSAVLGLFSRPHCLNTVGQKVTLEQRVSGACQITNEMAKESDSSTASSATGHSDCH